MVDNAQGHRGSYGWTLAHAGRRRSRCAAGHPPFLICPRLASFPVRRLTYWVCSG